MRTNIQKSFSTCSPREKIKNQHRWFPESLVWCFHYDPGNICRPVDHLFYPKHFEEHMTYGF